MLLVADIGNTNITFAIYENEEITATYRLTTWFKRTGDEYGFMITHFLNSADVRKEDVEDVIVASVVPKIMHSFINSIRRYIGKEPIIVSKDLNLGIKIDYDNPQEVGADRIVDAIGAYYHYGGDLLVIDFGTATTFEYISSDGTYHGGSIMPGLEISSEALTSKTAKLPEIAIKPIDTLVNKDTISAMQAGLFLGYIGSVEYLIKRFKEEIQKDLKVIATGGLGRIIFENTDSIDIYDAKLTFKGLKKIYDLNR